jgi:hypothetical protein
VKLKTWQWSRSAPLIGLLLVSHCNAATSMTEDAAVVTQATTVASVKTNIALIAPKNSAVQFKGAVNFDKAGYNSPQMFYPAANAVGFLAAIATHGLIIGSAKRNQKQKMLDDADQVLNSYQTILNDFRLDELMEGGLSKTLVGGSKRLIQSSDTPKNEWVIESLPVFFLTQDQSAIVMDNTIIIYGLDSLTLPVFQNTVRVVSVAHTEKELVQFWTDNKGNALKEESTSLFAESLDIALTHALEKVQQTITPYKTIRYFEGGDEHMERGQLLSENCHRRIVKTLRGTLLSVPGHCN